MWPHLQVLDTRTRTYVSSITSIYKLTSLECWLYDPDYQMYCHQHTGGGGITQVFNLCDTQPLDSLFLSQHTQVVIASST
jgi:hypothetical protein